VILVILTLPVTLLTLGLFIFVINALLFCSWATCCRVRRGRLRFGAARLDLVQRDFLDPGQRAAGRAHLDALRLFLGAATAACQP
jgi:hypothetical protein